MRNARSSSMPSASSPRRAGVLYQDRRITVTAADIRTANAYYPVQDTVGRLRRDPLWAALAYAALCGFALTLYFDLWFWPERLAMGGSILLALLIGTQIGILQLDARGFPPRMIIARAKTVRAVFEAITLARAASAQGTGWRGGDDGFAQDGDA